MIKILTWNVNSIRARIGHLINVIESASPDIILLQELKCVEEQFPFSELEYFNYNTKVLGQKARNGVALMSKFPLYDVECKLPFYDIVEVDNDSRYIEARIDYHKKTFKIASIYVPNGGPSTIDTKNNVMDITSTENFLNKMKFFDRMKKKFAKDIEDNETAFFCADYNVCPNLSIDVYSPLKDGSITNTQKERNKFRELLDIGLEDIWRKLNPETKEYTWWGYRPFTMFEKNQGYRLDAILTTPKASPLVKSCSTMKHVRAWDKPSDHVPVVCEINI
ncbi:MAG: exodeoxyribonuclease III [Rickettsiales bacterium]|jgi:exodeoxyribonuclease-3|nr:exodeoxyribonuclease III [Rickettsiales bacterium]